jgi:hypothetical protein
VAGKFEGAVGVMYDVENVRQLLIPLLQNIIPETKGIREGKLIKLYIRNPNEDYITIDDEGILQGTDIIEQLTRQDSGIFQQKVIVREVIKQNDKYTIRHVKNRSNSGIIFKLVAMLSPAELDSTNLQDYDYLIIMLQDNVPIEQFSSGLEDDIQSEFWILMAIIVGSSIFLCILIGVCVFWSTRKITLPIKKLTDLTSNIKKEHKIEEIRKTIKNHELFKRFQSEKYKKSENGNQDEIQELISIFYNFFIEENTEEQKNNVLKMTNYEYPRNLYYEKTDTKVLSNLFNENDNEEEDKVGEDDNIFIKLKFGKDFSTNKINASDSEESEDLLTDGNLEDNKSDE